MGKHWSERLSCPCGKSFRSISAEAVHRHNFPALCRHKPKAEWEVVAGLEWKRVMDGMHNGRPMYEYHAVYKGIKFDIVKSTDRGFGISIHDGEKYLTHHFGIEWRRTLKNCHERAISVMAMVRAREKVDGAASGKAGS